jgi:hypothetical protein
MEPDELERQLIEHGRRDRPKSAVRRRTMSKVVAAAAAGAGMAATSVSSGAAATLPWLVTAKWVAVGIVSGAVAVGSVDAWKHSSTAPIEGAPKAAARAFGPSDPRPMVADPAATNADTKIDPVPDVPAPLARTDTAPRRVALPTPTKTAEPEAPPTAMTPPQPTQDPEGPSLLDQELRLLDEARTALDGRAAPRALEALDRHARLFPSGSMRIEADALRIETLLALDRKEAAFALGRAFLAEHPRSPTAIRVRRLLGGMNEQTKE